MTIASGKLRDSLIIVLVSVAMLALLEAGLRVFGDSGNAAPVPEKLPVYLFDQEALIRLRPNHTSVYRDKPNQVRNEWHTNSLGLRGPEIATGGSPRIVVYGDSQVHAMEVPIEATFVAQLEARLREGGMDAAVTINAGLTGSGPDQHLIRIQRELPQLRPDIIVVHIFADNDFGDIVRNRLFELDEEGNWQSVPHATEPDQLLQPEVAWYDKLALMRLARRFARRAPAADTAAPDKDEFLQQRLRMAADEFAVYESGKPRKYSHFDDRYDMDIALEPDSQSATIKVRLLEAALVAIRDFTDANDVDLLVTIQPSPKDLTMNFAAFGVDDLAVSPNYDPRRMTAQVEEICERNGIDHLNLYDLYADNEPASLFYVARNHHWNEAGQALGANAVARWLLGSRQAD